MTYLESLAVATYNLIEEHRPQLEAAGVILALGSAVLGVVVGAHAHWMPLPSDAHPGQPYLPHVANPDPNSR